MLGKRIKTLRKKYGLTQEELAKLLRISHWTLGCYERGKYVPSATTVGDIARFFNVTTDSLIFGEDKK